MFYLNSQLTVIIDTIPEDGLELKLDLPWHILVDSDASSDSMATAFQEEDVILSHLRGCLQVRRVGDLFEVTGNLSTQITARCARCLCEIQQPLHLPIQLNYSRHTADNGAASTPDSEPDSDSGEEAAGLYFCSANTIELRPALYEQIVLALPMRLLCTPACKGLCQECGINLNQTACHCMTARFNNPFAALPPIR